MNPDLKAETILLIFLALVALNTLVGAIVLRACVSLCNKLIGTRSSPNPVPEPSFGHAALIVFLVTILNSILGFILGLAAAVTRGGNPAATTLPTNLVALQLTSILIGFLLLAGLSSAMLPTTFPRGLLVSLCYVIVTLFAIYGIFLISMTIIGK